MALTQRRIVVVGLGSIGQRHARLLSERSDVALELCEPRPDLLAAARDQVGDVPAYESFEVAPASRPDVVLLATPTTLHAEQSMAALRAGAHVFCEKPLCERIEEAAAVQAAAESSGRLLNVGFSLHFHPGLRRLREVMRSGELGQIAHVHARVRTYGTLLNSRSRYQGTLEGALFLDYSHQPDLFGWMLGRTPLSVTVAGLVAGQAELSSSPNVALMTLAYDAPLLATIHLNYLQLPERHEYEVVGDRAWARYDAGTGVFELGRRADGGLRREVITVERDDIYRAQIEAFIAAFEGRRPPEISAAEAAQCVAVCAAAREAWAEARAAQTAQATRPVAGSGRVPHGLTAGADQGV